MMGRLSREFFERETTEVAQDLLGRVLVRVLDGQRIAGRIVETEAYMGFDDAASHAFRGRTTRNTIMFGPVGMSYVYFTYGAHWLINVIAKAPGEEYGAAVLIRALEPLEGLELMAARRVGRAAKDWTNGPAKLTQAMGIDGTLNHIDLTAPDSAVFFEEGQPIPADQIQTGPRIGITAPEPWRTMPWRYWVAGNSYVSK
jgi:DNA-3-methyladenine glycosylase